MGKTPTGFFERDDTTMTEIDPKALTLEQLNGVKEQMTQEINNLQSSIDALQAAHNRFVFSSDAVEGLEKEEIGSEMLVPLTSSLYVPGKVTDTSNVLVDIGTGYMVEMKTSSAKEHFGRKSDLLKTNVHNMSAAVRQKRKQLQLIMIQMSNKAREQQAQQQAQQQPQ